MRDKDLLSSDEAGALFGVEGRTFDEMAAAEDWLWPVYLGSGRRRLKRWDREDVAALKRVLLGRGRGEKPPDDA